MIHIEGMGIMGCILAWELHQRGQKFSWMDTEEPVTAWKACTGAIFPQQEMENYEVWLRRVLTRAHPWHAFLETAAFVYCTKNPPHGGRYTSKPLGSMYLGERLSVHFNAQQFVMATRAQFEKQRTSSREPGARVVVSHGFSKRLKEYVWGWTVPVTISPAIVDGKRVCLYLRKGSFFQYAFPTPGTNLWYAGSSLIVQERPHRLDVAGKLHTWLRWLTEFTHGEFKAEVAGEPLQGWRPRGDDDGPELVVDNRVIYVKPHWHDGVRSSPKIMEQLLWRIENSKVEA